MNIPDFSVESTDHYPACLCGQNRAGQVFHRTAETEETYRKRFEWMSRKAHQRNYADQPMLLVEIFVSIAMNCRNLKPNSKTQYRAACLPAARDEYDLALITD